MNTKNFFILTMFILVVFSSFLFFNKISLFDSNTAINQVTVERKNIITSKEIEHNKDLLNRSKSIKTADYSISFNNIKKNRVKKDSDKLLNKVVQSKDNFKEQNMLEKKLIEEEYKKKKNKEVIENLEGIESNFIVDGNKVDMSIIQGIQNDDIFSEFLDEMGKIAANNQGIIDTTNSYYDSFSEASKNLESGYIQIDDFQCGEATCIASFTAENRESWNEFLANRSNEDYPYYTFGNYPSINEDGTIQHRVFFSINSNVNTMYMPFPPPGG